MFDTDGFDTENFDYEQMDREERPFARRLALWIQGRIESDVLDLGAGTGVYVDELRKMGIKAQGVDICDPQPRPDLVITQDLFECDIVAGLVLCIEVAEHLPAERAPDLIQHIWNRVAPGGFVIWSAAQPGQGGVGHINCQHPIYWTGLAQSVGFQRQYDLEDDLHQWITAGYHMGWFALNRQIWRRSQ